MRKQLFLLYSLFSFIDLFAQDKEINVLTYSAYQTITAFEDKSPVILTYKGYLYQYPEKGITVSFVKPLYFKDFPDGKVYHESEGNHSWTPFILSTDTLQSLTFIDRFNLKFIFRYNAGAGSGIVEGKYDTSFHIWNFTGQEKLINGHLCRQAEVRMLKDKPPFWEVWISDEMKMPDFFIMLKNCPGLVMEASNPSSLFTFQFESFKVARMSDAEIKQIFWPQELKALNLQYEPAL